MFSLQGKKALVTGATGGLGEAIAKALHAQGANLVISGTKQEKLDALSKDLGSNAHAIACNLADGKAVDANLRAAEAAGANGKLFNIASAKSVSINELFETLKRLTGREDVTAEYLDARVGDVRDSLADLSAASSVLHYTPKVSLEEGLQLTLDWWKTSRFSQAAGTTSSA
jgi:nucleoside-diphosphate-sugar epimerase